MKAKWLGVIAFGWVLAGCQNPFPEAGTISATKPGQKDPIPPAYILEVPEQMQFQEGKQEIYTIKASVPTPGTAIIAAYDLPEGAVLSPDGTQITWTPPFGSGVDPKDPKVVSRTYNIRVVLSSSLDSKTTVQRKPAMVVTHVARRFEIVQTSSSRITEGTSYSEDINIISEDFPQGPFPIQPEGLPPGAALVKDPNNPSHFVLNYSPDFHVVTVRNQNCGGAYCKVFPITLTAFTPRGDFTTQTRQWVVLDQRQYASVSGPTTITQGTEVSFNLIAEDLNGEDSPTLDISPQPSYGRFQISAAAKNAGQPGFSNPTSSFNIFWDQIPLSKIGTSDTLHFRVCVNEDRFDQTWCKDRTVTVNFSAKLHPAPVVNRAAWALGITRFVKLNGTDITVDLPITDAEDPNSNVTVEIFPESIRNEVRWQNGVLRISGITAGTKQFNVNATSGFGVTKTESFNLEVLPATWSPVLLLGEGVSDQELSKTIPFFDSVNIAVPALQQLDSRMLALRTTLVFGTGSLKDKTLYPDLEKATGTLKNIVLLSPLSGGFKNSLLNELKSLGVTFEKRFLDLPGPPDVADYELTLDPNSSLAKPQGVMHLAGQLTAESKSPQTFSLKSDSNCTPVLTLKKDTANFLVAANCPRSSGGRILVAGFEWADIKPTNVVDAGIAEKWMKDLVTP